jgi:hypothetical protein
MNRTTLAVFVMAVALFAGCGKQQPASEQAGTVSQSGVVDVMDSRNGYIIENARFASADDAVVHALDGRLALAEGTTSVLVIRQSIEGGTGVTLLALQFPNFAAGSAIDYTGDEATARFHVIGTGASDVHTTGALVSGQLRFTRRAPSAVTLGLDRTVQQGEGEMEISVSSIDAGGLKVPASKKYAASYALPIITLKELAAMNTAS